VFKLSPKGTTAVIAINYQVFQFSICVNNVISILSIYKLKWQIH